MVTSLTGVVTEESHDTLSFQIYSATCTIITALTYKSIHVRASFLLNSRAVTASYNPQFVLKYRFSNSN